MRKSLRWLRTERGQALIEFAFVAPLMFVFLFAIVDFGIAIDRRLTLQHAVREGARYAAVHDGIDDIRARTVAQAQDIIETDDVGVCYEPADGIDAGEPGSSVKVSTSYTWDFPIMSEMMSALGVPPISVDLTPSGTARLELSVSSVPGCAVLPVPTVPPP